MEALFKKRVDRGIFTKTELAHFSDEERRLVYVSITEAALDELKSDRAIVDFYQTDDSDRTQIYDFWVVSRSLTRVPLKVAGPAKKAVEFHKKHPECATIFLIDKEKDDQTKPTTMVKGDILRRIDEFQRRK